MAAYTAYKNLSLDKILGLTQPGGIWRLLAIVFALLNLKSLPFGWHGKVLYGLFRHIFLFKRRAPPPHPPGSLFQPVITSTRCTLLEMDYNLHKSNSTYFADLDVARMHHLACLMRLGLHRAHFRTEPKRPDYSDKGAFRVMFGGVTCSFKKEIRPYQSYEIWTRVLSWDQKWLYLVCHIVKKGTRPKGYTLQPWKQGAKAGVAEEHKDGMNGHADTAKGPHPSILAVSVAKYVFKRGRRTIPPEDALRAAELLPPKPETAAREPSPSPGSGEASGAETPAIEEKATENIVVDAVSSMVPVQALRDPSLEIELDRWNWKSVEAERLRGMEIAQHMVGLDKAMDVWTADEKPALGQF